VLTLSSSGCVACESLVLPDTIDAGKYCPACGSEVKLPEMPEQEPVVTGVAKTVEDILQALGKDVKLARNGANNWEVEEGSAKIKISYNTQNFFIASDAYLCQMPQDATKIKALYQFLLEENFTTRGMVLSCTGQNIVLSCLMYDMDTTVESGKAQLETMFKKADAYDDLLKEKYGCVARLVE
jgi:serine protease Do